MKGTAITVYPQIRVEIGPVMAIPSKFPTQCTSGGMVPMIPASHPRGTLNHCRTDHDPDHLDCNLPS